MVYIGVPLFRETTKYSPGAGQGAGKEKKDGDDKKKKHEAFSIKVLGLTVLGVRVWAEGLRFGVFFFTFRAERRSVKHLAHEMNTWIVWGMYRALYCKSLSSYFIVPFVIMLQL